MEAHSDDNDDDRGPYYHHFKKQTLKYRRSRRIINDTLDLENSNFNTTLSNDDDISLENEEIGDSKEEIQHSGDSDQEPDNISEKRFRRKIKHSLNIHLRDSDQDKSNKEENQENGEEINCTEISNAEKTEHNTEQKYRHSDSENSTRGSDEENKCEFENEPQELNDDSESEKVSLSEQQDEDEINSGSDNDESVSEEQKRDIVSSEEECQNESDKEVNEIVQEEHENQSGTEEEECDSEPKYLDHEKDCISIERESDHDIEVNENQSGIEEEEECDAESKYLENGTDDIINRESDHNSEVDESSDHEDTQDLEQETGETNIYYDVIDDTVEKCSVDEDVSLEGEANDEIRSEDNEEISNIKSNGENDANQESDLEERSFSSELMRKFNQMNLFKASHSESESVEEDDVPTEQNVNEEKLEQQVILRGTSLSSEVYYDAVEETGEVDENKGNANVSEDDDPNVDYFNRGFRYVLRRSQTERSSRKNMENYVAHDESYSEDGGSFTLSSPLSSDITRRSSELSAHITQEEAEKCYEYAFNDPIDDLNRITRSSVHSDGIMSAPQAEFGEDNDKGVDEDTYLAEATNVSLTINKRALPKDAKTYELEKFDKNAMIIFNQEIVNGYDEPRFGTRKDGEALKNTFSKYGFEITEHIDLTKDVIFDELEKFSQTDFTDYGCVAVAVLTHGAEKGMLRAKDQRYYETDILKYLKTATNHTLITKPKIIIIQACRGPSDTQALLVGGRSSVSRDYDEQDLPQTYTLPMEADILLLHSTFPGRVSLRDEVKGAWFIQTLCQKINELASTMDLESIATEVKQAVALKEHHDNDCRVWGDPDYPRISKQIPTVLTTLIRKLYFKTERRQDTEDELCSSWNNNSEKLPCSCLRGHFEYLKKCLKHFIEENDDEVAKHLLGSAELVDDCQQSSTLRDHMAKAISHYLSQAAKDSAHYKYLYLYRP